MWKLCYICGYYYFIWAERKGRKKDYNRMYIWTESLLFFTFYISLEIWAIQQWLERYLYFNCIGIARRWNCAYSCNFMLLVLVIAIYVWMNSIVYVNRKQVLNIICRCLSYHGTFISISIMLSHRIRIICFCFVIVNLGTFYGEIGKKKNIVLEVLQAYRYVLHPAVN